MGDKVWEGTTLCNLGNDYSSLGRFQQAKEYYQLSVEIFDIIRASIKSEDTWKISFREGHRTAYYGLWTTLLYLGLHGEALYAAERGRAQALVNSLTIQYGLKELPQVSLEKMSCISKKSSTKIVFLGIDRDKIIFWVISKENNIELRLKKVKIDKGRAIDSITVLLETTSKKIGAGVGVRCENRSLDEHTDDTPFSRGQDEEPAQTSQCAIDSLQPLQDAIISPIAELCQGDELIIVPDGPLCLAPFSALRESIRIRTVPSLTSLKLIIDSPEDYHRKSGVLLVGDPCLEKVTKGIWGGKPVYCQLPCAKMEVEMIGKILNSPPLTGTEATKKKVLEQITEAALVHFAAHGRSETGEIALAPNAGG